MTGDGPPLVDPAVERQRLVERAQLESDARLKSATTSRSGLLSKQYEAQDAEFQRYIDQDAQAYVALFDTPMFKVAERHDYDGRDRESGGPIPRPWAVLGRWCHRRPWWPALNPASPSRYQRTAVGGMATKPHEPSLPRAADA